MEDQLPNSQASVASGPAGTECLWVLEADTKEWCQKQGLGLPPGSSESSGNAGRESGQAPAKGSQVKVLILFLFLASCPLASSSPVSYLFALICSYFLCREQEKSLLHLFYPPVLVPCVTPQGSVPISSPLWDLLGSCTRL